MVLYWLVIIWPIAAMVVNLAILLVERHRRLEWRGRLHGGRGLKRTVANRSCFRVAVDAYPRVTLASYLREDKRPSCLTTYVGNGRPKVS